MAKNGKFDCFKCVLHCFRRRYDLYIPIYQNSNFHHFWLFFPNIFQFDDPNLARSSSGWVLGIWNVFRNIISLSKNISAGLLLRSLYYPLLFLKIVKKWNFTFGLHRRGVLRDEFLRSEKFFHRKVWNLENIFHMYNVFISPIVQKIFTLLGKNLPH